MDALEAAGPLEGARVLLPRADIGRESLLDELRSAGADVTDVVAYRTTLAQGGTGGDATSTGCFSTAKSTPSRSPAPRPSATSPRSTAQEQAADLLRGTVVASIGPVTAEAAHQLGISTTVMPKRYTIPDLVDALVEHFRGKEPRAHGR